MLMVSIVAENQGAVIIDPAVPEPLWKCDHKMSGLSIPKISPERMLMVAVAIVDVKVVKVADTGAFAVAVSGAFTFRDVGILNVTVQFGISFENAFTARDPMDNPSAGAAMEIDDMDITRTPFAPTSERTPPDSMEVSPVAEA